MILGDAVTLPGSTASSTSAAIPAPPRSPPTAIEPDVPAPSSSGPPRARRARPADRCPRRSAGARLHGRRAPPPPPRPVERALCQPAGSTPRGGRAVIRLPRDLAPWRSLLDLFPRELAEGLGRPCRASRSPSAPCGSRGPRRTAIPTASPACAPRQLRAAPPHRVAARRRAARRVHPPRRRRRASPSSSSRAARRRGVELRRPLRRRPSIASAPRASPTSPRSSSSPPGRARSARFARGAPHLHDQPFAHRGHRSRAFSSSSARHSPSRPPRTTSPPGPSAPARPAGRMPGSSAGPILDRPGRHACWRSATSSTRAPRASRSPPAPRRASPREVELDLPPAPVAARLLRDPSLSRRPRPCRCRCRRAAGSRRSPTSSSPPTAARSSPVRPTGDDHRVPRPQFRERTHGSAQALPPAERGCRRRGRLGRAGARDARREGSRDHPRAHRAGRAAVPAAIGRPLRGRQAHAHAACRAALAARLHGRGGAEVSSSTRTARSTASGATASATPATATRTAPPPPRSSASPARSAPSPSRAVASRSSAAVSSTPAGGPRAALARSRSRFFHLVMRGWPDVSPRHLPGGGRHHRGARRRRGGTAAPAEPRGGAAARRSLGHLPRWSRDRRRARGGERARHRSMAAAPGTSAPRMVVLEADQRTIAVVGQGERHGLPARRRPSPTSSSARRARSSPSSPRPARSRSDRSVDEPVARELPATTRRR